MEQLKLMYITNRPDVAVIAESAGVDRIFIDMEYIGKSLRQGGMDTVQSHHTLEDISRVRQVLTASELMVRCNPIHEAGEYWCGSREEIDGIVERGAQVIMLPYFKTAKEVEQFVRLVDGRAKTFPLVETREAAENIDEILAVDGIDEIYIGLNDLSLSYGMRFMFQVLADGKVDRMADKFRAKGLPFGFGGLASLDKGLLPGSFVLKEHKRLGSSRVILSRSFCNVEKEPSMDAVRHIFDTGVKNIRDLEQVCRTQPQDYEENSRIVKEKVAQILKMMEMKV